MLFTMRVHMARLGKNVDRASKKKLQVAIILYYYHVPTTNGRQLIIKNIIVKNQTKLSVPIYCCTRTPDLDLRKTIETVRRSVTRSDYSTRETF